MPSLISIPEKYSWNASLWRMSLYFLWLLPLRPTNTCRSGAHSWLPAMTRGRQQSTVTAPPRSRALSSHSQSAASKTADNRGVRICSHFLFAVRRASLRRRNTQLSVSETPPQTEMTKAPINPKKSSPAHAYWTVKTRRQFLHHMRELWHLKMVMVFMNSFSVSGWIMVDNLTFFSLLKYYLTLNKCSFCKTSIYLFTSYEMNLEL